MSFRPVPTKPIAAPFAGYLHDLSLPLAKRAEKRKGPCGNYYHAPRKAGSGLGFYLDSHGNMDRMGAPIRLRLMETGLTHDTFAFNEFGDEITALIARLPKGRGFLAGWTMGPGMCAELDATVHHDLDDARRAAVEEARIAAERQEEHERAEAEEDDEA